MDPAQLGGLPVRFRRWLLTDVRLATREPLDTGR